MKRLHRDDLWLWSTFDERLNIDFNSVLWTRPGGNVAFDPLPMIPHDRDHLSSLGGLSAIIVTNSKHLRDARALAARTGARILGPAPERETGLPCDAWLRDGDEPFPGLKVWEMNGSKSPGELALVLDRSTVFFGDLVRSHRAGEWMLLRAEQGLKDRPRALASVRRVVDGHPALEAVLVGDGWCEFRGARASLDAWLRAAEGRS